jgi:aminomethyltransferase
VFDTSPLFKYRFTGPGAERFLAGTLARDPRSMKPGEAQYTIWCDDRGFLVEDGVMLRHAADDFVLTAAEPNFAWFADQVGPRDDVVIEDVSDDWAVLSLQGPRATSLLAALDKGIEKLAYFEHRTAKIAGRKVLVSRTGYTGDLGYEVWCRPEDAVPVWDAIWESTRGYGVLPFGMQALYMTRIEAGLLLLDVDYVPARKALIEQQKSSPLELGLEWTVGFDKASFVGHEALRAERDRPAEWRFVGVEVDWEPLEALYTELGLAPRLPTTAWRTSVPLYAADSDRQVGYASSGCWSPLLKRYLTLAHLEAASADVGTSLDMEITVEHRRKRARAHVRPTPFYNPDRKRA